MRKLKLQVQMSLDGFIAGPNGEMDWMEWNWDQALQDYVQALTEPIDCIVLGRKLAEGFIPHWAGVAANPEADDQAAGVKFSETPKVVFTKTLDTCDWANTVLAKGDLKTEINQLKEMEGSDIIAYGGAEFVSSLIQAGVIDEYHFFVNPTLLGKGMSIFNTLTEKQNLELIAAHTFQCGICVMHYKLKSNNS